MLLHIVNEKQMSKIYVWMCVCLTDFSINWLLQTLCWWKMPRVDCLFVNLKKKSLTFAFFLHLFIPASYDFYYILVL